MTMQSACIVIRPMTTTEVSGQVAARDVSSRVIRVGIIGATGYVGGELVRLLARHPNVELVGLVGRGRDHDPIDGDPPHLATLDLDVHSRAAARGRGLPGAAPRRRRGARPGPHRGRHDDHRPGPRLPPRATRPTTRAGTASSIRGRTSSQRPSTACPSSIAPSSSALVDAPVRDRRRAGLLPDRDDPRPRAARPRRACIGDLVVDAKSGVSGAGREAKPDLMFGEVNESVKAYGIGGHRHVAEIEQELGLVAGAEASTRAPIRASRGRLPAPPHPDDPRHPVGRPRPADPADRARPSSTSCTRAPTPTSRS